MLKQQQNGVSTKVSTEITAESSVGNVMSERSRLVREHGDEWQDYIADKFEEVGIQPTFIRVRDSLGERIADYQYSGVWVEAKTFINTSEVTKIEKLFCELKKQDYAMAIMAEWKPNEKQYSKNVKYLRGMGIAVFEGQSECESFIIDESIRLSTTKEIKMAEPKCVPFNRIVPHPNNRDLNIKNVPTLKVSICKNGFFTQLNVVPLGVKDKKERGIPEHEEWYMIFEGHTRWAALKELIEKGYAIDYVACINVPWLTSDNIDELHKMLITTNTTYQSWKVRNYVKSHKGNLESLKDADGIFTYGMMLKAMNQAKKQGWGEASPVYIFSHIDSLNFGDMKKIKDGNYRISQIDYEQQIVPLLNLMTEITAKNSNGIERRYTGTIIRDILVDVRIKYNTVDLIRDNWFQFLGFLRLKFISSHDNGTFPETKESGQNFWKVIYNEYIGMRELGLTGVIKPYDKPKTILNFVN